MTAGQVYTSGADGPFFEGLQQGDLRLPACAGCGAWHWPAVFRCPECGAWDHVWQTAEPSGHIYSWTRTWHPFAGAEAFKPPYVSLVVELNHPSRARLMGVLKDTDTEFSIGSEVRGQAVMSGPPEHQVPALVWSLK